MVFSMCSGYKNKKLLVHAKNILGLNRYLCINR